MKKKNSHSLLSNQLLIIGYPFYTQYKLKKTNTAQTRKSFYAFVSRRNSLRILKFPANHQIRRLGNDFFFTKSQYLRFLTLFAHRGQSSSEIENPLRKTFSTLLLARRWSTTAGRGARPLRQTPPFCFRVLFMFETRVHISYY